MRQLNLKQDLEDDVKRKGSENRRDSQDDPSPGIGQTEKKEDQKKRTDEKSKKG
jgi:hypothetical protein